MLSSSEKITQPPWAQKHLGMSVNLATFGGENKEYKIKSQPIDRFCLISLLYNWTYELMVSPTLYNLGFHKTGTLKLMLSGFVYFYSLLLFDRRVQ